MVMANNSARRLSGEQDSRGPKGIFSRGKNVYNGGTGAAHSGGGPQFGRPRKSVLPAPRAGQSPVNPTREAEPNPAMMAIRRRLLKGRINGG